MQGNKKYSSQDFLIMAQKYIICAIRKKTFGKFVVFLEAVLNLFQLFIKNVFEDFYLFL